MHVHAYCELLNCTDLLVSLCSRQVFRIKSVSCWAKLARRIYIRDFCFLVLLESLSRLSEHKHTGKLGLVVTPFNVAYYMYGAYYTMATFSQSGLGLVVYS